MRGSCLCGSVVFEAAEPLRSVVACHCTQCRKVSGHFWAATAVPLDRFHLIEDRGLRWYRSSAKAERGFCGTCGASLFWKPTGEDRISIAAGTLDGATGLTIASHWHLDDAGDYYTPDAVQMETEILHGSCLCGDNAFTLPGPMGEVWACHCTQCRKTSGHFAASFEVEASQITWQRQNLAEHASAAGGIRSFCPRCGSSLAFRLGEDFSLEAGAIDNPTGGRLVRHIFTADKGDYYDLTDGLPQNTGA